MSPAERHNRIAEIFQSVVDLPEDRRCTLLDHQCDGDASLRAEVIDLLRADSITHHDARAAIAATAASAVGPCAMPETIGRFRIIERLGEGGMGVVYLAEQQRPNRRVAVKVLREGAVSEMALRRFELEADLLARLEHPGIAHIYEAGTQQTMTGCLPYFAMELVSGKPITRYARDHQLTNRDKLELIAKVCEAVQHAHTKGIVHRDLKPGNILVGSSGQPKVLDFGVARVSDSDIKGSVQTDFQQIIGTLQYMSPEQAAGDSRDVDTRTDVYSLGVVLYEMLAGKPPLELADRMVHDAVRVIREQEPTPLSTLNRDFRGDLETIAAKAMEKDRSRRYQTAADLGADVRRFLHDEPIMARPPSATYEIGRFMARHRSVVVQSVLAASIVIGAVMTAFVYRERSSQERALRAQADGQRAIATAAFQRFLTAIAGQTSDSHDPARDITLKEAFAAASQTLDERLFPDDPGMEAEYHSMIGNACYLTLGLPAIAERHFRRALELSLEANPLNAEMIEHKKNMLALSLIDSDRPVEAKPLLEDVVASQTARWHGSVDEAVAQANLAKACIDSKDLEAAATALTRALELRRTFNPPPSPETIEVLAKLGDVHRQLNQLDQARAELREALGYCDQLEPTRPGISIATLRYLARVELRAGNGAEAVLLANLALVRTLGIKDANPARTIAAHVDLGKILHSTGDLAGAEEQYKLSLTACNLQGDRFPRNKVIALTLLLEVLGDAPDRSQEVEQFRAQLAAAEHLLRSSTLTKDN